MKLMYVVSGNTRYDREKLVSEWYCSPTLDLLNLGIFSLIGNQQQPPNFLFLPFVRYKRSRPLIFSSGATMELIKHKQCIDGSHIIICHQLLHQNISLVSFTNQKLRNAKYFNVWISVNNFFAIV